MNNFNPKDLTPGQQVETQEGKATFIRYKKNPFRDQNYEIQYLYSGRKRWCTELELKQANKDN